jgi:hypothetical protein
VGTLSATTATATSLRTTQIVSSGGYPLDANGQALVINVNTQTPALLVSNYTAGLIVPTIQVRGYGQNRQGGTSTTQPQPGIIFEGSRGTHTSPTALGSGDVVFSINGGGYDGSRWASEINLFSGQFFYLASEAFSGSATTATNAGTRLLMRVQPQGVQLNATSRQYHYLQTWTAGSSSAPPILNITEGSGVDNTTPTLTMSNGTDTHQGYGRTNLVKINTNQFTHGVGSNTTSTFVGEISATTLTVTSIDSADRLAVGDRIYGSTVAAATYITALGTGSGGTGTYTVGVSQTVTSATLEAGADNTTLTSASTNNISIVGNRRSGVSGRRNALKTGDRLGGLVFYGQTTNNSTGVGSIGSQIFVFASEDFSSTGSGATIYVQTADIGTNTSTNRLELNNERANYSSDIHSFYAANNTTLRAEFTATGVSLIGTVNVNNAYSLSTTDGTSGQVLTTNGTGSASWGNPGLTTVFARNALPSGTTGRIITISDSGSDTNSPAGNYAPAYWDPDATVWTYIGNSNSVTPI